MVDMGMRYIFVTGGTLSGLGKGTTTVSALGALLRHGDTEMGRPRRMEVCELPSHRFFVASQFHPEFKSKPGSPAPLFLQSV